MSELRRHSKRGGNKIRQKIYDMKDEHLECESDIKYKQDIIKTLENEFSCGKVKVQGAALM